MPNQKMMHKCLLGIVLGAVLGAALAGAVGYAVAELPGAVIGGLLGAILGGIAVYYRWSGCKSVPEPAPGYVGNANTKEIHDLSRIKKACQFSKILEKNKVYLASLEEVDRAIEEQGYNGCKWCMPERDTG